MIRRRSRQCTLRICTLALFLFAVALNFYANVWNVPTNRSAVEHTYNRSSKWPYVWTKDMDKRQTDMSSKETAHAVHVSEDETVLFNLHNTTVKLVIDKPSFDQTMSLAPTKPTTLTLWPDLDHFDDDRILTQLRYTPARVRESKDHIPLKKILLYTGYKDWDVTPGRQMFIQQKCPVNTCILTDDKTRDLASADAIIFRQAVPNTRYRRPPNQIWILYLLESAIWKIPTQNLPAFNWTATYRRDSDIVTPYEKFVLHNEAIVSKPQNRNYAAGKRKKVAWFVSNCNTVNKRLEYARELGKHIQVDIYGRCGRRKCSKEACFNLLNTEYKFYLSFENSNCRDYISEKFFTNGLQHDVIPIVMGAHVEDYRRVAPYRSFIHVDEFPSPRDLALYLHVLDQDDDIYNEYFQWKGTGTFINTYFWCRVCAMLHDTSRGAKSYSDVAKWWQGPGVCIEKSPWKDLTENTRHITHYYNTGS